VGRLTLILALGIAALQAGSERFAGTWTAEYSGTTFARLDLAAKGGTVSGMISLGNIELNAKGEVKHAESAPPGAKPIFAVTVRDTTLTFSHKDEHDMDQFEMRLTGPGTAELLLKPGAEDLKELAAEGIPAPKPIPLKRK